ncbi:chitinase [Raphidocelis subcapitata]|uniref:Chitinase n=1 Tax=Raphidocelis subcapitata TaxID=307507 RepID=A0A2V0NMW4_9CHLO|nr:chitinase [Raphidocelis subcapitata]|eukprot:GBF88864.1 chitinase [Raphidocelis subcapitata]
MTAPRPALAAAAVALLLLAIAATAASAQTPDPSPSPANATAPSDGAPVDTPFAGESPSEPLNSPAPGPVEGLDPGPVESPAPAVPESPAPAVPESPTPAIPESPSPAPLESPSPAPEERPRRRRRSRSARRRSRQRKSEDGASPPAADAPPANGTSPDAVAAPSPAPEQAAAPPLPAAPEAPDSVADADAAVPSPDPDAVVTDQAAESPFSTAVAAGTARPAAAVLTCPRGKYLTKGVCADCSRPCAACSSATTCSVCKAGYTLVNNYCELPGPIGCFADLTTDRALPKRLAANRTGLMTSAACRKLAQDNNLPYFGTQNGFECWAGSSLDQAKKHGIAQGQCITMCTGSSWEECGGVQRNSLFFTCPILACPKETYASKGVCVACPRQCAACSSATTCSACKAGYMLVNNQRCDLPGPIGCFADLTTDRALPTRLAGDPAQKMTSAACRKLAQDNNLPYFGTQNGFECWAGSSLDQAKKHGSAQGQCSKLCTGSSWEDCGGVQRNSLFFTCPGGFVHNKTCVSACPKETYASTGVCVACPRQCAACSSATTCSACKAGYMLVNNQRCELPGSIGCFADLTTDRALPKRLAANRTGIMTSAACRKLAQDNNLPYFGTQNGFECWAGSNLDQAKKHGSAQGQCSKLCTGSSWEDCGGVQRNSLFSTCPSGFVHNKTCEITRCGAGTGGSGCDACPIGWWSAGGTTALPKTPCKKCPDNTTTPAMGATSKSSCVDAPSTPDCSGGCNAYCSRSEYSPVNGTCADAANALRMPESLLVALNPDLPCNGTSNDETPLITAAFTHLCVAGTLRPISQDILDPANPTRVETLQNLAESIATMNPSLQDAARAFISDPNADSRDFTGGCATALASDQAFATRVAADPFLSETILSTLPGRNVTSVCEELASNTQGAAAADVYDCMCRRGPSSPPLVACIGKLAELTSRAQQRFAARAARGAFDDAAEQLGEKLRAQFGQSSQPLAQGSSAKKQSSLEVLCDGWDITKSMSDKFKSCNVKVKLPIVSTACSLNKARQTFSVEGDNGDKLDSSKDLTEVAGKGGMSSNLLSFLTEDAFGVAIEDCCVGIKIVDVCVNAGFEVPTSIVLNGLASVVVCNKLTTTLIEGATGIDLSGLTPEGCFQASFTDPDMLTTIAESKTGFLDVGICVFKDALGFMAPCLNVVEAAWRGFAGEFDLGASLNVLIAKSRLKWTFQVHEPWELICRNEEMARSKPYCCNCVGGDYGEVSLEVWQFFRGYQHMFGSPWSLKDPPNCEARWEENHSCSKRSKVESLPPMPGSPDKHNFQVRAIYTTSWAQWRKSNNGRPEWCDKYGYTPGHLNPNLYTHVYYAFVKIAPDFTITNVEERDDELMKEIRSENGSPKKMLSIGGWSFSRSDGVFAGTDASTMFPRMAASAQNRATFIASAIQYALDRGFDGLDLDWEHPNFDNNAVQERSDFTTLLREMYPACKQRGLLLTAATRAINTAQHYEVSEIHNYLDWINVMSYDFYGGGWSKTAKLNAPIYDCQSRWCKTPFDIDTGLREYLDAGVPREKLVLGLGTYGRTFTLAQPSKDPPPGTAAATGVAEAGECTMDPQAGILAWYEIKRRGITPQIDPHGMAAYATWGSNNQYWVGFDTKETLRSKVCWAASLKLGGTMAWDGELDDDQELLAEVAAAHATPRSCPTFMPKDCTYTIKAGDTLDIISGRLGTTVQALLNLNPGIKPSALQVGQVINVPCAPGPSPPTPSPPSGGCKYTIKAGDTLSIISGRLGTTVQALQDLNPGINPSAVQVGQVINVPCAPGPSPPTPSPPSGGCKYTIKAGDTLWGISQTYSTTVQALQDLNPGINPSALQVGQVINVPCAPGPSPPPPSPPSGGCKYTIKAGDTLWGISQTYSTTVQALLNLNPGIKPEALQVGQVINVPC